MNIAKIQELYKKKILPESKDPYHYEIVKGSQEILAYNPVCGDKFRIYLDLDGQAIKAIHFHGFGCALSKASTSIMLRKVDHMSLDDARQYCSKFLESLQTGDLSDFDAGTRILLSLRDFEGRLDCIKLAWEAFQKHLEG